MTLVAVHSGKPLPGKRAEAMESALEVMRYLNENYPERHIEILESVDGPYMIHFVSRHVSWAAREESIRKLNEDEAFREIAVRSWALVDIDNAEWHFYTVKE